MIKRRIGPTSLAFFLFISICAGADNTVYKIMLLGNMKVEEGVIRGAIKSQEGDPLSVERIREDLRSIFDLGFFTDVQVDIKSTPQGYEVIFIVVEKPSVKEILIKGNEKVKLDDIKEKITLKLPSILNLEKVKENLEQIRKLYFSKGYYGVKVEYKVDYLENNEAVITFTISEGPKGSVQKIVFKGNKAIKTSDLKKLMKTKEKNLLSFITKTGVLDEDILKNDLQMVTAYYFDHGYLDVKISEPKIDLSNPKKIQIEMEIVEGPQYRFGDIDFKGDLLPTKEALFKVLKIKRGDIYSITAVRMAISTLTEKFANQGYAYAEINPETSVDNQNLLIHITIDIDKKRRVSFEKIQIVGNSKTRNKVVRRELLLAEGELYNAAFLNKSRDRLKRTGFFKEVDFATSRGSTEEKINLDIKVEEAPTGALSFGIGYGSVTGAIGTASLSDRNLFGLGYSGSLRFALGTEVQNLRLSFTDPYFLGYRLSAGTDLYRETNEYFGEYFYKIMGGDIRFGKELTDTIRIEAMYKLENVDVYNVSETASAQVKAEEGKKTTSAISFTPSLDTRDDYFNPRRGSRSSLLIQNAGGPLGGDNYFVRVAGETSWYFPLFLNTTLNLRAKIGVIEPYGGKTIPLYEKFYVGGMKTVRGFEYGMAGPLDVYDEPIGASKMVVFNTELIFPLSREIGLRGALFLDIGKGFDNWSEVTPLRFGAGPGIRWFSPFGPIHIDIGFNLNPKKGEKRHVIEFTAGTVY